MVFHDREQLETYLAWLIEMALESASVFRPDKSFTVCVRTQTLYLALLAAFGAYL